MLDRGYDSSVNYTDPFNRHHLIETQRDANGLFKTQFAICAQTMGETLRYMGTSTVARDIDYITTLLDGEDALLYVSLGPRTGWCLLTYGRRNFYGLSYGTVMGQYLVNMCASP